MRARFRVLVAVALLSAGAWPGSSPAADRGVTWTAGSGRGSTSGGSAVEVTSPAGPGPRLTLRAARTSLVLGDRTRLAGAVTGVARAGGLRVRIEADDHPFGRFRTLARVRTRADGTYGARFTPAKNVRLRAVLERTRPTVRTASLTVWTELPIVVRRLGAGGRRPRVRVTLIAPARAGIRRRRVVFYLASATETTWQRVLARHWTYHAHHRLTATARYPSGRLGSADRVLVCTREPRPDAFGKPVAAERHCGAPRLARAAG